MLGGYVLPIRIWTREIVMGKFSDAFENARTQKARDEEKAASEAAMQAEKDSKNLDDGEKWLIETIVDLLNDAKNDLKETCNFNIKEHFFVGNDKNNRERTIEFSISPKRKRHYETLRYFIKINRKRQYAILEIVSYLDPHSHRLIKEGKIDNYDRREFENFILSRLELLA